MKEIIPRQVRLLDDALAVHEGIDRETNDRTRQNEIAKEDKHEAALSELQDRIRGCEAENAALQDELDKEQKEAEKQRKRAEHRQALLDLQGEKLLSRQAEQEHRSSVMPSASENQLVREQLNNVRKELKGSKATMEQQVAITEFLVARGTPTCVCPISSE